MAVIRSLFVVTHPEAEHHLEGRVGGWHDSALTERGRRHARAIGAELRRRITGPAEVISSDLARTWETAEAIAAELGTAALADPRLREISYGIAEGREQSWLDERFVFPPAVGDRLDHDVGIDGAETRRTAGERVYAAVDEALTRDSACQVIVTHGFAHTFVVGRWLELPLEAMGRATFATRPGGITELREDDAFRNRTVHSLAEVGHLVAA
ncbi:histidine phosphatase family protein [Brevibacterium casei]|uniref:Histidine phosphatase family protein n=1 Tax=Brevibacterium casei TaxID=33889 RepID=A0A269Z8A7_9MICO|nr:histidine phosphatase family protein [Brevibacterium casei]PAK94023.1 histidine phosphatase family protein [Brevibacterium casei]QPS35219.1 histidine phosphatase family protein [Brevibacterium casei]